LEGRKTHHRVREEDLGIRKRVFEKEKKAEAELRATSSLRKKEEANREGSGS